MSGGDPLAGGAWVVASVGGQAPPAGGDPSTLAFDDAGRVSGRGGVNRFTGPYSVSGDVLSAGPLATTRMAGPPEWMALECRLLAVLGRPVPFVLAGDALRLEDPGNPVELTRAPAAPPSA